MKNEGTNLLFEICCHNSNSSLMEQTFLTKFSAKICQTKSIWYSCGKKLTLKSKLSQNDRLHSTSVDYFGTNLTSVAIDFHKAKKGFRILTDRHFSRFQMLIF